MNEPCACFSAQPRPEPTVTNSLTALPTNLLHCPCSATALPADNVVQSPYRLWCHLCADDPPFDEFEPCALWGSVPEPGEYPGL